MGTTEPGMKSEGRDGPRALIFRAVRSLAEREGVENLTLGKIAIEAQLPRPVVYGQFIRKEDLLLCVAADSVATLARTIGGIDWSDEVPTSEEPREGAVILTMPRPEPAPESPETMVGIAREVSMAMGASSEAGDFLAATGSDGRARRTERTRTTENFGRAPAADEIALTGDEPEKLAPSSERVAGATPPIESLNTSIEHRLSLFEQTIAAIDARQEQLEKSSHAAAAEGGIKEILEQLNALVTRVDDTETRQKAAAQEARAALNETNVRIQTVESVARAALVENGAAPVLDLTEEVLPVQEPPLSQGESEAPSEAVTPAVELQPSFLASARASAIAAALPKAEVAVPKRKPKSDFRTRYIAAGLVITAVFVAAAGVAFSQGVQDGRNEALRNAAITVRSHAAEYAAARTPLDRLTARAEAGDSAAELAIAATYLSEAKSARDPAAGFHWMTRAAVHGNAVAQYMLGTLYQQGTGTAVNAALAMRWYEAAALQGNRKAMHNLAVAYAQGLAGVKSASEAVRWLSRAANLGYVDSQFDLAVLYERGDGVPVSLLDAFKWYAIAGAQGDAESKSRIDALRTQLSADDLAAAQRAADSFQALPFSAAANLPPKI